MAHGRRVERVASMIRREMSELLVNGVRDERVNQGMVSITNVVVAGDLQHCKVSVSIFGSESEQDQAMAGLRSAAPYLRGELSRRLNMRRNRRRRCGTRPRRPHEGRCDHGACQRRPAKDPQRKHSASGLSVRQPR